LSSYAQSNWLYIGRKQRKL